MNQHVCHVCKRWAVIGHSPYKYSKLENIKWFCDECSKIPGLMQAIYKMNGAQVHDYEILAVADMSPKLGEYIEKVIGSTDIATWTEDQWFVFLLRSTLEFGIAMRKVTAPLQ